MLNLTLAMARKDLSVTLTRSAGLVQALLLGLLLIFMFSPESRGHGLPADGSHHFLAGFLFLPGAYFQHTLLL